MDSSLTRVTAPATLPVTLAELKSHLRVNFTDEDTLLEAYLDAAIAYHDGANGELQRCIIPQTWDYRITDWPSDAMVKIPLPPTLEITGVYYLDDDGVSPAEQTVDPTLYRLIPGEHAVLWFKDDFTYPATLTEPQNVRIRFRGGWEGDSSVSPVVTDASQVPETIKQSIKLLAGHWFEQRTPIVVGASVAEVPFAVQRLINLMKVYR